MHITGRDRRTANLVGAAALALTETMLAEVQSREALGSSAASALVHLRLRPGENIDFLARVVGITHAAAVRLVDRLASEGFVERHVGEDGRARSLVLTARGGRAAARVLAARERTLATALGPLSGRQRAELAALLEKLLDGLTTSRWHARHICRLCDYPTCASPWCPVDRAASRDDTAVPT